MICFRRIKHALAVIRENPIPRLALHCVIGPGSYNIFIFLYLALRCLFYALVFLGGNPFRVIRRGPLIYRTLKIKINNCFSSHTSHMTDLEFIVLT